VRRVGLPKPHAPEERGADAHVTTQTEPEAPRRRPGLHRTDRCILAGDQSGVCCLRPRIILLDGFQFPCDAPDEQGCSGSSCRRANGRAAIPSRLSQPDWRVMPTDYLGGSPPLSPSLRRSRCRRFRLPHGCAASSSFHVRRRRHVWRLRSRAKVFLESSCGSLVAIIKRRQRPRKRKHAWDWSRRGAPFGDASPSGFARCWASVEPPSYTDAPPLHATWRVWRRLAPYRKVRQ
jgi:hypothetical protein